MKRVYPRRKEGYYERREVVKNTALGIVAAAVVGVWVGVLAWLLGV